MLEIGFMQDTDGKKYAEELEPFKVSDGTFESVSNAYQFWVGYLQCYPDVCLVVYQPDCMRLKMM